MKGERLWIKAECQTGPLTIVASKNTIEEDGHELHACYEPDRSRVTVADTEEQKMKRSLLHELLHVCFDGASGDLREKVLGGKTKEERDEREELIVSFLESPLFDLLTRNGWLRFPKPPRFE